MFLITGLRRKRLQNRPMTPEWLEILKQRFSLYSRLSEEDRAELRGHIQVFVAEKRFEGGSGLIITDEKRLVVAAHACTLLLHRKTDYYPGLSSIIIYPAEFLAPFREVDELGIVSEGIDRRSGESWQEGALVLSWEDIEAGELDVHAGYNVVIHEFAHQLDAEDGITSCGQFRPRNGSTWDRILEQEYLRLQRDAAHGRTTLLDPYGAESRAEFFAVATECFFEIPRRFRECIPRLYAELAGYFKQDPASWPGLQQ
jgi:Mlc titration factor MtfA (ptsG expression regulator)